MEFLVKRDDLHETRLLEDDAEPPEIEDGQALLAVDTFGMTANNVTYAVFGEAMSYWDFFPAPDGWGRMPIWGFASVRAGRRRASSRAPASTAICRPPRTSWSRRSESTSAASSTPRRTEPRCPPPTRATAWPTPTRF